jgi:hypothetical protein
VSATCLCPECGSRLRFSHDLSAGTEVKCPKCGAHFALPDAPAGAPEGAYSPVPPPPGTARPPREDGGEYAEGEDLPRRRREGEEDAGLARPSARRRGDSYGEGGHDEDRPVRGLEGVTERYAIDLREWLRYARAHWSAVLGPMIGYYFIVQLISFAAGIIPFAGICVQLLLMPPLQAGFYVVALAQLTGKPWTFGDFFAGFHKYGPLLVYFLLTILCVLPPVLLTIGAVAGAVAAADAAGVREDGVLVGVGIAAGILPFFLTVYISVRTSIFGWLLILDRDCEGLEALKGSWAMTRGHFWGLLGVQMVLGLINLGGLLLLIVGVLFTFSFTLLAMTAGYLLIAGTRRPVA